MTWDSANEEWGAEFKARACNMLDLYSRTLSDLGYEVHGYENLDARLGDTHRGTNKYDALCHAMWMCTQAQAFIRQGRQAKAYRWIGMVQGLLWAHGVFSLDELKGHNELDEEFWARWDRRTGRREC